MHRNVLLFSSFGVYYAISFFALYIFESGLLLTSVVLFGLPAYFLARYSAAPSQVLIAVVTFGAGLAILLEGIAHIYGIWYTMGVDELRLFGLIPLEVIVSSIVQTLFLALLYELIFDDGQYSTKHVSSRFIAFLMFSIAVVLLIAIHQYLLQGVFFSHSYIWILGILTASSVALLAVSDALTLRFFQRLMHFSLCAFVPLGLAFSLAVSHTQKIFAYQNDYFYSFTVLGNLIPLEEILMLLVLPLFVATFYEIYLDDRR